MTRAYSVSLPVCSVLSQLSNVSSTGHTTQISKTSVSVIRDASDRMGEYIADSQGGKQDLERKRKEADVSRCKCFWSEPLKSPGFRER